MFGEAVMWRTPEILSGLNGQVLFRQKGASMADSAVLKDMCSFGNDVL